MKPKGKSMTGINTIPGRTIKRKTMLVEGQAAFQITSDRSSAIVL
jgi:hypothetical protein